MTYKLYYTRGWGISEKEFKKIFDDLNLNLNIGHKITIDNIKYEIVDVEHILLGIRTKVHITVKLAQSIYVSDTYKLENVSNFIEKFPTEVVLAHISDVCNSIKKDDDDVILKLIRKCGKSGDITYYLKLIDGLLSKKLIKEAEECIMAILHKCGTSSYSSVGAFLQKFDSEFIVNVFKLYPDIERHLTYIDKQKLEKTFQTT